MWLPTSVKVYGPWLELLLTEWNVKPYTLIEATNRTHGDSLCKINHRKTWVMRFTKENWCEMWKYEMSLPSLLYRNSQNETYGDSFEVVFGRFYAWNQKRDISGTVWISLQSLGLWNSLYNHDRAEYLLEPDVVNKSQVVTKSFLSNDFEVSFSCLFLSLSAEPTSRIFYEFLPHWEVEFRWTDL